MVTEYNTVYKVASIYVMTRDVLWKEINMLSILHEQWNLIWFPVADKTKSKIHCRHIAFCSGAVFGIWWNFIFPVSLEFRIYGKMYHRHIGAVFIYDFIFPVSLEFRIYSKIYCRHI